MQLAERTDIDTLKAFAKTMIWAFPLVFCLILPWLFSYSLALWPLGVSLVLVVLYFLAPGLIYFPYRLWMGIALVLGWINTRIILSIVFFLLIFPMGLALRLVSKLQYKNNAHPGAQSYYIEREQKVAKEELERPF